MPQFQECARLTVRPNLATDDYDSLLSLLSILIDPTEMQRLPYINYDLAIERFIFHWSGPRPDGNSYLVIVAEIPDGHPLDVDPDHESVGAYIHPYAERFIEDLKLFGDLGYV